MTRLKLVSCGLLLLVGCWLNPAFAGRSCDDVQSNPTSIMKGLELAQKTKLALDDSGAELAIIARVGQDLSKYNLRYSHLGLVYREPNGRWNVLHELNQCGTAESSLFNEGLGNFFMDDVFAYETMLIIPNEDQQKKLKELIDTKVALQLHDAHYNMLAFPFSTKYQNSNQWALELLAAGQSKDIVITNRGQAQNWLKLAGYQPSELNIPALTRLGARMFRANVAFDDHPMDRRMAGKIDVVTVESINQFMQMRDPQIKRIVLTYP
ncbi:DUF2145 domain-containing protein [Solimicrobium silvestre]|uniref:DUF2145 domain-containing protein n=1 Tax=Solimicrobium silvestre TaxID=2099400 RepID=A0A2S9H0A5_9BURK|nr:DUF2145 domain-containing protein [Solimicrobium silvestre]PRC93296.1 hypothetical protein S2091_2034 [Solimicrobium silvestre]